MTDYAVVIISPPGYIHNKTFREVAETINQGLINLGHTSFIRSQPTPGRKNIVMGANLLPTYPIELVPDSVLYNVEQVKDNPTWITPQFLEIHKNNRVWDFCKANADAFKELGVTVENILPVGYVDQLTRIKHREPENDVMFCGWLNERRINCLNGMINAGLTLKHFANVYGSQRDIHIGGTKVMLNVQAIPPKVFEIVRISYYLANKMPVISERPSNMEEYSEYEEAICFTEYENFTEKALELCKDDTKRNELANRGFEIMSQHKIENYLKDIL